MDKPEQIMRWWEPKGFTSSVSEIDLRLVAFIQIHAIPDADFGAKVSSLKSSLPKRARHDRFLQRQER